MTSTLPVLLLTGYLGSGKTTLVNHILTNQKNIKFAVIVNDIGEVNIDASLIQKGGIVNEQDDSLIALQNGCICCSLKMDLLKQLADISQMNCFDYIVIEASGICEPEPIARTIYSIPHIDTACKSNCLPKLDCIVTVVDALRMQSEFSCGESLCNNHIDDNDIANLLIQQIEFCNIILLNKISEVQSNEIARIKQIIIHLNPSVKIIDTDYALVDMQNIINTHLFDYESVATSASWVKELDRPTTEEEEREAKSKHCHHHHHEHHEHHHDDEDSDEYGISTFTYYRRNAFKLEEFDQFLARKWPKNIIRAKGICYFSHYKDMSYLFEQAGVQKKLTEIGLWYATAPKEDLKQLMQQDPGFLRDWDNEYGDRMIKIVFIGQNIDKEKLIFDLDNCLE